MRLPLPTVAILLVGLPGCGEEKLPPLEDSQAADVDSDGEPAFDIGEGERWVFMQSHLHTTGEHECNENPTGDWGPGDCYSSEGINYFLRKGEERDAGAMIITDHNNVDAWFDPAFTPRVWADGSDYTAPIRGVEWTNEDGHLTIVFPDQVVASNAEALTKDWIFAAGEARHAGPEEYAAAVTAAHEVGGLAIINHPELFNHDFPSNSFGADGVEIGVPSSPLQSVIETLEWWHERLIDGDRLTGMTGADHHHDGAFYMPSLWGAGVNLIRVDPTFAGYDSVALAEMDPRAALDLRSDIVVDAIARGHVMNVESNESARVYFGADTDGDGRFHNARSGDCLDFDTVPDGDMVAFRVRIVGAEESRRERDLYDGLVLELWTELADDRPTMEIFVDVEDGVAAPVGDQHYLVDPDDPFAITFYRRQVAGERRFVRLELNRNQDPSSYELQPFDNEVATNPIYLGDWGDECITSTPIYAAPSDLLD